MRSSVAALLPVLTLAATVNLRVSPPDPGGPYGRWQDGPAHGKDFFRVAVWLALSRLGWPVDLGCDHPAFQGRPRQRRDAAATLAEDTTLVSKRSHQ